MTGLWWLAALTALRLAVAAWTPLSPDEAYYWVWSRALAAGYPDHPPMVALFVRAGTSLAGPGVLGVRLLVPVSAAFGSLLLARAGRDLFGRWETGVLAAALLNATLLFGVGSVTMTPDTPLLLFWTACVAALARLVATRDGRWWLAVGMAAGLALDSKYTAVLLGVSVTAWLLWVPTERRWLATPWPWLAAAVATLIFAPVLAWNATHRWVSFVRQGGRATDFAPSKALSFMAELIGGQIGLATPLLALLFVVGIGWGARRSWRRDSTATLLTALTFIPALVFAQHALGDRVQANWPAILYPSAALAAAAMPGWRRWRGPAMALGVGLTALVWLQGAASPFALPRALDPTLIRTGGWQALASDVADAVRADHAAFVATDNYGEASLLARLLPPDILVVGADPRWALFDLPRAAVAGRTGLLLQSARRGDPPDGAGWATMTRVADLSRSRDGVVAERYALYRSRAAEDFTAMPRP